MLSSGTFTVLPIIELILRKALTLCSNEGIKGVKFWDVAIIATMLENGISILYTENLKDFKKFTNVVVIKDLQEIE